MAYCIVEANIVKYDGETPDIGARLNVYSAIGDSVIIGNLLRVYTMIDSGIWYPALRFQQSSTVYIQINSSQISVVNIPASANGILETIGETLVVSASTPPVPPPEGETVRLTESGGQRITEDSEIRIME